MKRLLYVLICIFLLASTVTAKNWTFSAHDGTTGGTTGKLDNIDSCDANGSGYDLQNKDGAIVWDQAGGRFLFYIWDSSSTADEVNPTIIVPDACNSGAHSDYPGGASGDDGRWILADVQTSGGLLTTLLAAKADESIVGTSLNALDLVNSAGVLETVSTIPHTNVAETLSQPWDLANSDCDTCTGIPLDSDFNSNGIMVRTGAGTYGIGTTFDIALTTNYFLMGVDSKAAVTAPATALAMMTGANGRGDVGPTNYEGSTDYNSTIDGISNTFIEYQIIDGRCFVNFQIDGDKASEGTNISFTLPATCTSENTVNHNIRAAGFSVIGGTGSAVPVLIWMGTNTTTVNVFKDGVFTSNWSNDDAIVVGGQFNFKVE